MTLQESLKIFPECKHLKKNPFSKNDYCCSFMSEKLGRLSPTSPASCNIQCKKYGPYCGNIPNDIDEFMKFFWNRHSPLTFPGVKNFSEKILRRCGMPANISIPQEYESIKKSLNFLFDSKKRGFRKILLTGSVLLKNITRPLKDYDVVLWFDDIESITEFKDELEYLPKEIDGTKIDYFYYIGDEPEVYFACLDVENKILYNSHWMPQKINKLYDGISVIEKKSKFENVLLSHFSKSETSEIEIKSKWGIVKDSWIKADSFISSILSRGITPTIKQTVGIDENSGIRIDEQIYNERKISCFGDENTLACNFLKTDSDKESFCGACGCGSNKLARLNSISGSYSKLHYPHLECPLKKKGFSNYEIPMSIIIPVLNDNEEVNLTIKSIRNTTKDVDIIVIDDGSDTPVVLDDKNTKLIRFNTRRGAGEARHYGASIASSDKLLFIDSHMRFTSGWLENSMRNMENNPKTLWCGICLGLNDKNMDVNKPVGEYTGATLCLYNDSTKQVFEGVWQGQQDGLNNYEIPCIMGACYFIYKDWFFYIRGLETNRMWGYEEPFLSIKTWLAGGEVRLMRDVKIGHKFRDVASYSTNLSQVIYNKIRYMYLTLPTELYDKLLKYIPEDGNKLAALQQLEIDMPQILKEKEYYKKIFIHDIYWLCDKFKINL